MVNKNRTLPTKFGNSEITGNLDNGGPNATMGREAYRVSWEGERMLVRK